MYDGRYFQYCGGYSVQWRDIVSTMKGYYEHYGGILSVIEGYSVLTRGIISTLEGYHQYGGENLVQSDIPHQMY